MAGAQLLSGLSGLFPSLRGRAGSGPVHLRAWNQSFHWCTHNFSGPPAQRAGRNLSWCGCRSRPAELFREVPRRSRADRRHRYNDIDQWRDGSCAVSGAGDHRRNENFPDCWLACSGCGRRRPLPFAGCVRDGGAELRLGASPAPLPDRRRCHAPGERRARALVAAGRRHRDRYAADHYQPDLAPAGAELPDRCYRILTKADFRRRPPPPRRANGASRSKRYCFGPRWIT